MSSPVDRSGAATATTMATAGFATPASGPVTPAPGSPAVPDAVASTPSEAFQSPVAAPSPEAAAAPVTVVTPVATAVSAASEAHATPPAPGFFERAANRAADLGAGLMRTIGLDFSDLGQVDFGEGLPLGVPPSSPRAFRPVATPASSAPASPDTPLAPLAAEIRAIADDLAAAASPASASATPDDTAASSSLVAGGSPVSSVASPVAEGAAAAPQAPAALAIAPPPTTLPYDLTQRRPITAPRLYPTMAPVAAPVMAPPVTSTLDSVLLMLVRALSYFNRESYTALQPSTTTNPLIATTPTLELLTDAGSVAVDTPAATASQPTVVEPDDIESHSGAIVPYSASSQTVRFPAATPESFNFDPGLLERLRAYVGAARASGAEAVSLYRDTLALANRIIDMAQAPSTGTGGPSSVERMHDMALVLREVAPGLVGVVNRSLAIAEAPPTGQPSAIERIQDTAHMVHDIVPPLVAVAERGLDIAGVPKASTAAAPSTPAAPATVDAGLTPIAASILADVEDLRQEATAAASTAAPATTTPSAPPFTQVLSDLSKAVTGLTVLADRAMTQFFPPQAPGVSTPAEASTTPKEPSLNQVLSKVADAVSGVTEIAKHFVPAEGAATASATTSATASSGPNPMEAINKAAEALHTAATLGHRAMDAIGIGTNPHAKSETTANPSTPDAARAGSTTIDPRNISVFQAFANKAVKPETTPAELFALYQRLDENAQQAVHGAIAEQARVKGRAGDVAAQRFFGRDFAVEANIKSPIFIDAMTTIASSLTPSLNPNIATLKEFSAEAEKPTATPASLFAIYRKLDLTTQEVVHRAIVERAIYENRHLEVQAEPLYGEHYAVEANAKTSIFIGAMKDVLKSQAPQETSGMLGRLQELLSSALTEKSKALILYGISTALTSALPQIKDADAGVGRQVEEVIAAIDRELKMNPDRFDFRHLINQVIHIMNDGGPAGKLVEFYLQGFIDLPVRRLGSAAPVQTGVDKLKENLTTLPPKPQPAPRDPKKELPLIRERVVNNVSALAAMSAVNSGLFKNLISSSQLGKILTEAPKDKTFFSHVKKAFFKEIDKSPDMWWGRKLLAKGVFTFVSWTSGFLLRRTLKHGLSQINEFLKPESVTTRQNLHRTVISKINDYLSILKGTIRRVQSNKEPTANYDTMIEKELARPEFNGGLDETTLYSRATSNFIKDFIPNLGFFDVYCSFFEDWHPVARYGFHFTIGLIPGITAWLLAGIGNLVFRFFIKQSINAASLKQIINLTENQFFRNGYSHSINKIVYSQLQQMWEMMQKSGASSSAETNSDSVANKEALKDLVINLQEVLELNHDVRRGTSSIYETIKKGLYHLTTDYSVDALATIIDQAKNTLLDPEKLPEKELLILEAVNAALESETVPSEDEMLQLERDIEALSDNVLGKAIEDVVHKTAHPDLNPTENPGSRFVKTLQDKEASFVEKMKDPVRRKDKDAALKLLAEHQRDLLAMQELFASNPQTRGDAQVFDEIYIAPLADKLAAISAQVNVGTDPDITIGLLDDLQRWSEGMKPVFHANLKFLASLLSLGEGLVKGVAFKAGKELLAEIWRVTRTPYNWRFGLWHHGVALPLAQG